MGLSNEPDKSMTEHRFLQSFLTVGASVVLVGSSLLVLTSTAPFPPPQAERETSTSDSARLATEPSTTIEFPRANVETDQAGLADDVAADRTYTASTDKEPDAAEPEEALAPEAPPIEEDEVVAALGTPLEAETEDAGREDTVTKVMIAPDPVPEPDSAPNTEAAQADNATLSEPDTSIAEKKASAASDQIGALLTDLPPRVIASDQSSVATGEVGELLAVTPPAPPVKEEASPELAVMTSAPPLPKRKPEEAPQAPKAAALPAQQPEKVSRPEESKPTPRQDVAQEGPRPARKSPWRPLALAPADQDKPAVSHVSTARPTSAAYARKVWTVLARHKPRAGQSGSTVVMFAIGSNGSLRAVKVGRSSGNARIDQLALATVRRAAPFPPPPSGSASYSIRIDFH
jgi:periplasmic protein TonB